MNSAVKARREKIRLYNSDKKLSPLIFTDISGKAVKIKKLDLKPQENDPTKDVQLVRVILNMSKSHRSIDKFTGLFETGPGKNRSIIDIYRHALDVNPDVDIYSLMEAVHYLYSTGYIFGQFCGLIRRSVFRSHNHPGPNWINLKFNCKDYKIRFSSWKNLH